MRGVLKKSSGRRGGALLLSLVLSSVAVAGGGGPGLPKEVRGYKVERVDVRAKKSRRASAGVGGLVTFGEASAVSVGPLEIELEVPVTIAPVEQGGRVERLVFEDIRVNGVAVTVEDYERPFDIPKSAPLTLPEPLRLRVGTASAVLGTVSELLDRSETWPVTGRVYVCGRFKRFFFSFKRAVAVELRASIANPL